MPIRLRFDTPQTFDWLSRLLDVAPSAVTSICAASMALLGASTRIGHSQARSRLGGSAVLEDGTASPPKRLASSEIVLLPHGGACPA
jgi:hypothetical protein